MRDVERPVIVRALDRVARSDSLDALVVYSPMTAAVPYSTDQCKREEDGELTSIVDG